MNKQERLNKIIEAIKYIADVDNDIALGYAGIFEEICDEYIKTGLNIMTKKSCKPEDILITDYIIEVESKKVIKWQEFESEQAVKLNTSKVNLPIKLVISNFFKRFFRKNVI